VPQSMLPWMKRFMNVFVEQTQTPEIILNDWGLLRWALGQDCFRNVPLILGFLLTHQQRDAHALMFEKNLNVGMIAETNSIFQIFLAQNRICSLEITSTQQPSIVPEAIPCTLHTYLPFSFFSMTRYCPYSLANSSSKYNRLPTKCDTFPCRGHSYSQTIKVGDVYVRQYYIGNAQWYRISKASAKVARVIDNSDLLPENDE
jgi:hypothetical protein